MNVVHMNWSFSFVFNHWLEGDVTLMFNCYSLIYRLECRAVTCGHVYV